MSALTRLKQLSTSITDSSSLLSIGHMLWVNMVYCTACQFCIHD